MYRIDAIEDIGQLSPVEADLARNALRGHGVALVDCCLYVLRAVDPLVVAADGTEEPFRFVAPRSPDVRPGDEVEFDGAVANLTRTVLGGADEDDSAGEIDLCTAALKKIG